MNDQTIRGWPTKEVPSLEAAIGLLSEISDVANIDPDATLADQEIDSLDLIEFAAAIEDHYRVAFDDSLLDETLPDQTLKQVYELLIGRLTDLIRAGDDQAAEPARGDSSVR